MARLPKQINTRKIQLIREMGYDENQVSQDGFDHEGFTVIKFGPDGKVLLHSNDEVVTERVLWPDREWSRRAGEAMGGDFDETYAQPSESPRCAMFVGPDRCELRAGHAGAHHTMWGEYEKRTERRQDRISGDLGASRSTRAGEHISERQTGAERPSIGKLNEGDA